NGGTLDGTGRGADLDTDNNLIPDRPTSVPSRSNKALVNSYTYGFDGLLQVTTDPRGIVNLTVRDALGRATQSIESFTGSGPSDGDDRATDYTYDGDDHILTMTAELPDDKFQKTQYVYNATQSGGSSIDSHDLLSAVQYPDKTT